MPLLIRTVYAEWLKNEGVDVKVSVHHAALDPFRGYANAIRAELPDAVAALEPFHVVRLGSNTLDEVRRRVPQETLGPARVDGRPAVSDPTDADDRARTSDIETDPLC